MPMVINLWLIETLLQPLEAYELYHQHCLIMASRADDPSYPMLHLLSITSLHLIYGN